MNPRTRACPAVVLAVLALAGAVAPALGGCGGAPAPGVAIDPGPAAVFNFPLRDAAVGEELVLRRGATTWRWRVASTDPSHVGVEVQEYMNDAPVGPLQTYRWHRNGFGLPEEFIVQDAARDRLSVGGTSWDCWRLMVRSGQATRWYWVTDAVPVHGVLRIAVDAGGKGAPDLASAADYVAPAR